MSSPAPFSDIRTRLLAAAVVDSALTQWPNEPFVQPDPPQIWLSVEVTSHDLSPVDIGANVWQEDGTLYVDVLAPQNSGTNAARAVAKAVATAFRAVTPTPATPVVYTRASIGNGTAEDRQGNWWKLTVTIEWRYQDVVVSP